MAGPDDDAEKEFAASQRKLDDARREGDVPKSADLTAAAAQLGLLLALTALGAGSAIRLGAALSHLLSDATALSDSAFGTAGTGFAAALLLAVAAPILPWFALPAALALIALVAQRGVAFSAAKLVPKLSRLDPIANARQKFGPNGLVEFLKSMVKLIVVSVCLLAFLSGRLPRILAASALADRTGLALLMRTTLDFLILAGIVAGAIGALDLLWQRHAHNQKLRMTRKEMRDEHKDSEGDPHAKQQRRQRGYDIATNRMLQDVPKADVVIVNPTHYAVALKWDRKPGRAPICVAKGVDEVAARIRLAAMTAGVPLHSDPPTARALHATLKIGDEIHPDHYRTVAAAIRFAETIRKRARQR